MDAYGRGRNVALFLVASLLAACLSVGALIFLVSLPFRLVLFVGSLGNQWAFARLSTWPRIVSRSVRAQLPQVRLP